MSDLSKNTASFTPVKTNDIVTYNGQKHLVVSVHLENNDIRLNLQPLDNSIKTVSMKEVVVLDEQYSAPIKAKSALTITKAGREAWDYGTEKARTENNSTRQPYSQVELISRVKSLLLEEIQKMQQSTINQQMVDHVVQRLAATQAYLVIQNNRNNAIKSNENFIDWRQISLIAIKMANMYNQSVNNGG